MPTTIDAGLIQALIAVVIFGAGMLVSWLVWLTLRHYDTAKPAYRRLFGDDTTSEDGHIETSNARIDELDDHVSDLSDRVDRVHDGTRKNEQTLETVLSNQKKIADGLGVDLDRPRFYRGGGGSANRPEDDATDD
jgi:cell division protein FtsL